MLERILLQDSCVTDVLLRCLDVKQIQQVCHLAYRVATAYAIRNLRAVLSVSGSRAGTRLVDGVRSIKLILCRGVPPKENFPFTIPTNLTSLVLVDWLSAGFRCQDGAKIEEYLPPKLKVLHLGSNYKTPVQLPETLEVLNLGWRIEGTLPDDWLPKGLKRLRLPFWTEHPLRSLPPALTHLSVTNYNFPLPPLPATLQHLRCGHDFDFALENLPENLQTMSLRTGYKFSLSSLPRNLKKLRIGRSQGGSEVGGNVPVVLIPQNFDHLPRKLEKLRIGVHFNAPVDHLPSTLTTLVLGPDFGMPLENLPRGLLHLVIGLPTYTSFRHSIDKLPSTVRYLAIGDGYDTPVTHWPTDLQVLKLSHRNFANQIALPFTLRQLGTIVSMGNVFAIRTVCFTSKRLPNLSQRDFEKACTTLWDEWSIASRWWKTPRDCT